ncbi:MAG: DUF1640 domain-containing protein [Acidobacteria bacterium]|nr:DUF1640 domain-containing protein [Acidobacteriota bacterium]MDE0248099.1 DUF1640 domain-containing protein [Gammaproteobacteria bacterium]
MTYALDTHAAIRDLEATGLSSTQAEAIVATIAKSDSLTVAKADLDTAVARLEAAIATSERRTILAVLAVAGLLFAALRLT